MTIARLAEKTANAEVIPEVEEILLDAYAKIYMACTTKEHPVMLLQSDIADGFAHIMEKLGGNPLLSRIEQLDAELTFGRKS